MNERKKGRKRQRDKKRETVGRGEREERRRKN